MPLETQCIQIQTQRVSQILKLGNVRGFNVTGMPQSKLGSVIPSTATVGGHKGACPFSEETDCAVKQCNAES